ncbi:MAG: hypothetical protein IPI43_16615 [Sandaracinaceae bacterium]|nr:hypothetical protein [Sandaracinaceae bacterium]MBK7775729.1 hypothetical protein [Sandaracinaceae bacterium]MBK8592940.1 hypothetical protein [Sandaracinaceae bacterium]MBP7683260.1 hypothetical protein [Deltaproteobacteria bacterium]
MRHVSRLGLVFTTVCLVASLAGSARADFRSTDPADWVRNRCVARNVMVAGLITAPVGLLMVTDDDRVGMGATMIAASGATLATGMTLRILQPGSPVGVNSDYAQWARNGCMLRSLAIYGGPVMALGAVILADARSSLHSTFGRALARIMIGTGVAMIGLGLTMTLYGAIRVRRRDGQPALDLGAPLVAVPVRGGSLALGVGSLAFSGAF